MPGKKLAEKVLMNKKDGERLRRTMDLLSPFFKLSYVPLLARLHPWTRPDKSDMRWLPINEDIELPQGSPLPLDLLDRLIEEASHRVIYDKCGCRYPFQCKDYPVEIGCLLMGDSAMESSPSISREVGVEEAKEHSRRAVEAGLVPVVGKARIDNYLFGIKDRSRLLTVCYCCECCCITRYTKGAPMRVLDPIFPKLDGIAIEVTDDCEGCGKCAKHCYIGAIKVVDGKAVIGEYCRACGRCAGVCPNGAVKIRIEDPQFLEKAYDRIRSYVKYD